MSAKHDYLTVSTDEIAAFTDDSKVLSIRPSGIVGIEPAVAGNCGALSNIDSTFNPTVRITAMGNVALLEFGGTVGHGGVMTSGNGLTSTVAIPAAFRPVKAYSQGIVFAVTDTAETPHAGRTPGTVTLGTNGILTFEITWGTWQLQNPPNGYNIQIEPFTLCYVTNW